jgi:hydrogenase nickel incorporation protein HypA/HybF
VHELPVIKSVLDVCVRNAEANGAHKVLSIELKVGKMSDLEAEWMQRYFDFVSKGTLAEGAKLVIERTPVVLKCQGCAEEFEVNLRSREETTCPVCGGANYSLISGREYYINTMEVL